MSEEYPSTSPGSIPRFLVFKGDTYYPWPGWKGLVGTATTQHKAEEMLGKPEDGEWGHVVDLRAQQIVAGWGEGYAGMSGPVSCAPAKGTP